MAELERECEVVVVGAGYSGLAAARLLARAGVEVLVLDARHRVGGRSFTDVTPAGFTVDRGGQWIGPTQDHLAALAAELGVATFPTYTIGQSVELRDGKRELYVGLIPTSDPHGAADGIACMLDLDLSAFDVPLEAPWDAVGAAGLDAQTLATYLDTHLESPSARAIIEVAVKAIFGTGPGELSLLFTLFYLHAGGGLTNLARTTGGAEEGRFTGGSQQLAEGMAAELGHRVMLGAPVETVVHGPEHVTLGARLVAPGADPADPAAAHRSLRVRARRAVLAMAPALCGRLTYSPVLPGRRDQLCQRMPMGAVTKIHVLYDEPFWRHEGLNGQIVAPGGVMESTFDNSPEDGSHGAIVGFIAGDDCRRMEAAGPEARRGAIVADLERAFGPQARRPVEIVEQHWPAEPFTRGGPVAVSAPGALTALGPALRAPVGPLHWAGTETATHWCGYLDGALSAGMRAADEVLHALKGRSALASTEELLEAYAEWRSRSNANPRLIKMVQGWDRVIHFTTTDTAQSYTMRVQDQQLSELAVGHDGQPDVVVTGSSEDFCDMFWGDLNPSEKYMSGEITLLGSQQDVMRIDAISMVAFLDT